MTKAPTFAEIERALDAGKVEMIRPHGDWVPVRRRNRTSARNGKSGDGVLKVFMEGEVKAEICRKYANHGFPDVRVVP